MSHRKRKPPRVRAACPQCRRSVPATPAALLQSAADALNACRAAGLELKVRHGVIECAEGLLLPLSDGTVVARTRLYTPFADPGGDDIDG